MIKPHRFTDVTAIFVSFVVFVMMATVDMTTRADPVQQLTLPEATKAIHNTLSENLRKVYTIGTEVGNAETLQAIMLQESGGRNVEPVGNKNSPVGKRSYGLMQVQLVAARSIFERYPSLLQRYFPTRTYGSVADEEIIALLLTDDDANIRIAAYHFRLYLSLVHGNWERAVAANNAGIGGVKKIPDVSQYDYVIKVKAKLEAVKRLNRKLGLSS